MQLSVLTAVLLGTTPSLLRAQHHEVGFAQTDTTTGVHGMSGWRSRPRFLRYACIQAIGDTRQGMQRVQQALEVEAGDRRSSAPLLLA